MAESNLGTAVLALRVDTDSALAALAAFRKEALAAFSGLNTGNPFDGFGRGAASAGRRVGRRLRNGVEDELKQLKFESVKEALNFNPTNTIAGLRTYSKALRDLAEVSDLASGDTQDLFDRISAVDGALKRASSSSAQLAAEQRAVNAGLAETVRLREQEAQALLEVELQRGRAIGALKSSPISGRRADGSSIPGSPSDPRNPAPLLSQLRQATTEASSFDISSLRRVNDAAVEAGLGLQDFTKAIINGQLALPKTTANLNEITRSFQSLAASTKSGTAEFNNFTQAGAKAGQKALLAQLDELKALRQVFEFGRAPNTEGGFSKDSFRGTEELLAFAKQVERTPAAIQVYITALEQAQAVTKLSDDNFAKLTAEIDRQRAAFDAATRSAEAFSRIQQLTAEQRKQVAESFTSAARNEGPLALPSSDALSARIAADGGNQPQRLQPSELNQTREQQLAALRQQAEEAKKLAASERQSKDEQVQLNSALEAGLQVLRTTLGVIDEQVQGYKFQNEQLDDQLSKQRQLLQLESERTEAARKRLAAEAKERRSREEGRGRAIGRLNAVPIDGRLPGGGFAPGSPGALNARNRQLREAGSNALIGGAFPALFGQGLGASVGGALGGGAGGLVGGQFGFGLSLVGTALGSQFDIATQKLQTLGQALSDPVKQFSALTEAGLISSKGLEKQIQALIDTGREAEAAALIQQDLASSYGDLQGAKELAAASDELNRSWAKLQATTASLVGLPLVSLLSDTSSALLVFAEAISKLKNIIPKPVADAGGNFLKQFALGGLLPGVKTVQDAAKFTPGSQGISGFFGGLLGSGNNKEQQAQNQQLQTAKQNYAELNTLAYQLVAAQAQGNKELEIGLRKRELQLKFERDSATLNESNDPGGIRRQSLIDKAKQDAFALDEQLKSLTNGSLTELQSKLTELSSRNSRLPVDSQAYRDSLQEIISEQTRLNELKKTESQRFAESIAAANQLRSIQEEIAIQQQRGSLTGTGIGALQAVKALEDAKRAEQDAQAALGADPGNTSLFNASQQAAANVQLAAAKTKADLEDAFRSAQDAVRSISRSIEDSVTALNAARGSADGVNKYIGGQQAYDRQAAANVELFREASQLAKELGVTATFSGTLSERNNQITEFINAARQELRGQEDLDINYRDLAKANKDLFIVNDALLRVNAQLAEATYNLASKDWNVYVNVPATADLSRGVEVYQ